MTTRVYVNVAVEGLLDAAVARRALGETDLELGPIGGQRGKPWLDANLRAYNQAAQHQPWLVLRDLDHDAACAAALVQQLLPHRYQGMCLRVCVRAVEAWLLADLRHLSAFLQVPAEKLPELPDTLEDPKAALVALARRSRSTRIREDWSLVLERRPLSERPTRIVCGSS